MKRKFKSLAVEIDNIKDLSILCDILCKVFNTHMLYLHESHDHMKQEIVRLVDKATKEEIDHPQFTEKLYRMLVDVYPQTIKQLNFTFTSLLEDAHKRNCTSCFNEKDQIH